MIEVLQWWEGEWCSLEQRNRLASIRRRPLVRVAVVPCERLRKMEGFGAWAATLAVSKGGAFCERTHATAKDIDVAE